MGLPALAAPIALRLAQAAALVAIGAVVASRRGPERIDMRDEETLDRLPEGADLRLDPANGRADAETRILRTIRLGPAGPGVELDIAALGRVRARFLRKR